MKIVTGAAVIAAMVGFGLPAEAKIVSLTVQKVEPFAGGAAFGAVGAYERVIGTAKGEIDPRDKLNSGIVDIAKAPRNAGGMVEYETEFFILRPVDAAKGNHEILYEVNNRGNKLMLRSINRAAPSNDPQSAADAGDGLLFRLGFTVVWSGWDPDVPRNDHQLGMSVPVATDKGQPIVREIRDEFMPGNRGIGEAELRLSYEAASFDQAKARLTVRRKEAYAEEVVPVERWKYADTRRIQLQPAGTKAELGAIYEFYYPAKNPKVTGIGFAATRDFVSFLRQPAKGAADLAPSTRHALVLGISQSGRFLRDFLWQGFNQDEAHRRVFDAAFSYIAGAGKVFLNTEFAEPFRTNTQHEDHFMPENAFPFSEARMTDPVTGRSDAVLHGNRFDPLIFEVNSSTEYWQKGASLLTTDPLGQHDVALPAKARAYMIAGTQHYGVVPAVAGFCANVRNPHDPAPALRALLVDLDAWLNTGKAPPASQVPSLATGTLVEPAATGFPPLPSVRVAAETNWMGLYGDWVHPKPDRGKAYRALVPKVDADGNETSGIRLPDIAVPIATYTGWNVYSTGFADGELCDRYGTYVPFARSRAEREAKGDPRASLDERYGSADVYVAKLQAAADALVKDRLLLAEDAAAYVAAAKAHNPLQ